MGTITYHLGKGVLICPNGQEFKVIEMTVETGDPVELKDHRGIVYHSEPSKDPIRVSFKEDEDG